MRLITTRRVDELGRFVLPREVRKTCQIEPNSALDIYVDDSGQIVLRKFEPFCKICGKENGVTKIAGKDIFICAGCKQMIREMKS